MSGGTDVKALAICNGDVMIMAVRLAISGVSRPTEPILLTFIVPLERGWERLLVRSGCSSVPFGLKHIFNSSIFLPNHRVPVQIKMFY